MQHHTRAHVHAHVHAHSPEGQNLQKIVITKTVWEGFAKIAMMLAKICALAVTKVIAI